ARIDGELDRATTADFDLHVERCPECLARRHERAALGALLARAREDGRAPPAVVERIRETIAANDTAPRSRRRAPTWTQALGLAFGAAALASVATFAM